MQASSHVFETAVTILQLQGQTEQNDNPRYHRHVYRDEKVEIVSFVDVYDGRIREITVRLFLPDTLTMEKTVLLVFKWDSFARLFRRGRWTNYLRRIARRYIAETTSTHLRLSSDEPVNDRELFPDDNI